MSAAQVITVPSSFKAAPIYPFLSQPPPQKRRPTQPLPPPPPSQAPCSPRPPVWGRRRSATTSSISAWVANVHPGSPAPYSPRRSPSAFSITVTRRSSGSSGRIHSSSFLSFDTPTTASRITPSIEGFKPDLTAMGYTSVFVHYPKTPFTPDMNKHISSPILPQSAAPPSPSKASSRGLKHFRSLTALKPSRRARSRAPPSPPLSAKKTSVETRRARAQSIMNSKKLKYSKALPAPLGNELALAQLMDGGKLEAHVKCFAENQAKAVGAVKVNGQLVGVGDVWRDEQGGIWMDQDEEWEFTHLLGEDDFSMHSGDWIRFDSPSAQENKSRSVTAGDEHRRSLSTQDSDLSPRYAMNAESESQDDLAVFGSILAPTVLRKPGMSVLSIPARSRRSAKHLRKPEFLLNVFPIPLSPQANDSSTSPRIAAFHVGKVRPQGQKARRRPAPLTLVPLTPGLKRPTNPADPDQIRQDFLLDSFAPRPRTSSVQPLTPLNRDTSGYHPRTTSRPSLMSMKSFFKARSAKKVTAA